MSEICTRRRDGEDCANGEISGVALTGRVYEPRSVRPLLTSAPVSVAAVDMLGSVDTTTATTQAPEGGVLWRRGSVLAELGGTRVLRLLEGLPRNFQRGWPRGAAPSRYPMSLSR